MQAQKYLRVQTHFYFATVFRRVDFKLGYSSWEKNKENKSIVQCYSRKRIYFYCCYFKMKAKTLFVISALVFRNNNFVNSLSEYRFCLMISQQVDHGLTVFFFLFGRLSFLKKGWKQIIFYGQIRVIGNSFSVMHRCFFPKTVE